MRALSPPASLHTQLSECRSVLARERDALNAARANVGTLRAENARLRAALESICERAEVARREIGRSYAPPVERGDAAYLEGCLGAERIARAALENVR